ncbi:MAG: lipoyl(octanoyl) transferase [Bacteroidetes bacterium CG12_big_fil_rev_8_21_14_0_65_60_17]|nr:MAG: lipoyl(octanoyl) transferase [Bacteroidetes bacterium CG12_big_fil_rev_8_21_14_0_65_60_17]
MTQPDALNRIAVCRLGPTAYSDAWNLQKRLQARLVANKRSPNPERLDHVLLLLEHPPVFTLGKSGDRANLLATDSELASAGAEFVQIDRGGDITYHGPGQLVGYPILDLDCFYTDIHRYLRDLEEVIIGVCREFGLATGRMEGLTGVWVKTPPGQERKICAMGIRCSRWVTMHGFALNVDTDPRHFDMIVPCGIADRGVTSLVQEGVLPDVSMERVMDMVARHMARVFAAEVHILDGLNAQSYLSAYLDGSPTS